MLQIDTIKYDTNRYYYGIGEVMKILILLLLLSSISEAKTDRQRMSELSVHVNRLFSIAKSRKFKFHKQDVTISFSVQESMVDPGYIGVCIIHPSGKREIRFLRSYWDSSDYTHRDYLTWHEIGHCVFNKDHDGRIDMGGHPISIMYPNDRIVDDEEYYWKHILTYQDQYFDDK